MTESLNPTAVRLLEATLEVVRREGVASATSRQIATEAGVNLQAITYHFGSKDELVAQALVRAVRAWVEPAQLALRDAAQDPAGHLLQAVVALQGALSDASQHVPAYIEALALVPRRPEFKEQITAMFAELRRDLATTIEELREAGLVAAWVDPVAMAALIVAAADGVAIHLAVAPDAFDPDDVLAQVVALLLAASTLPRPLGP